MTILKSFFGVIIFICLIPLITLGQNVYDTIRTVKMTAIPNHQLNSLTIQWKDDPNVNTYELFKKMPQDTSWGNPIFASGDVDTNYVDTDIEEGKLYEYRIVKQTGDSLGYAYLFSGVNYQPPTKRGDVLILIESIAADFVADNLNTYLDILISEGWKPHVIPVAESATVPDVKSMILQNYSTLDSLTAVLLMGNIAVPHSGNISPDGHQDHIGAWPADNYYGDMDGVWTDETVDNISSVYPRLHNVPGDGNFDQGFIPSDIELMVGRMDFSELPVFDLNEYELLDRYLEKNISFRTGEYQVNRRAVFSNLNPWKEGLGQNAIRNFVPIVSNDSLGYGAYFDAYYDSFLWSYGGSSGSMINSNGLGSIYTYADNNFQAVFTANFGSYFGDYDFENNYLRTILASGKVLSSAWVGAPNWYFHPMGLGFDIGFCTRLTQNNEQLYYGGFFPKSVTINLLGDPTLKAFIVLPPSDLQATPIGNHVVLSWSASEDNILGYQVYHKEEGMDYFEALNLEPTLNTTWVDSCVAGTTPIQYLVKAVKQEITPSGSFINHSIGPIISVTPNPNIFPSADFNLSYEQGNLMGTNLSNFAQHYEWILPDGTSIFSTDLEIPFDQSGEIIITLIASNDCFSDTLQRTITITDLVNTELDQAIYIYPNPTKDFFTIETGIQIDQLQLYNILGVQQLELSNIEIGQHIINLQNFATGDYVLKIRVGEKVMGKKIRIVQD